MNVDAKITFKHDVKGTMKLFDQKLDKVNKRTAKVGAVAANMFFLGQFKRVAPDKHDEHLANSIKTMKSKRRNGGWLFGTFASGGGKWEETVGGRAFFFEYGRNPPGLGRASVGRANYVKITGRGAQPARPFMRPAKNMVKPLFRSSMEKEFTDTCRRLNKMQQRGSNL